MMPALASQITTGSASGQSRPALAPDLEIRSVDPLVGSEWDRLVRAHPDFTFFHSAAWAKVLVKTYRHRPCYLHFSRGGEPMALVPLMEVRSPFTGRRGVCLPFSDFCSPLLFNKCEPSIVAARLSALALERNWKHIEVRDGNALALPIDPAVEYRGHTLELRQGVEGIFAGFSSSVRRAIRKAEQSKLSVEVSQSRESVVEFYRLHVRTRRRHGLPPQPFSFFCNILDEVILKGLGFVVRASVGSRCVAAAIFFYFGRTGIYKFGASEPTLQQVRGNNLVMWEGIRFLARSGCESVHFGRTSLTNTGLRRFKSGWGTTEEVIKYLQWDTAAGKWVCGRDSSRGAHNTFFAKMPLAINRLAGALLYPHLD
jgi:hypothetical protein